MIYFVGTYQVEGIKSASIKDVVDYCTDKEVVGLDIETTRKYGKKYDGVYKGGLDPYLSKVVMLQIGDLEKVFVIDTRSIDITPLKPILEGKQVKTGANLKFEYKHLKHNYGIEIDSLYDVMLVDLIQTNGLNLGYSLKEMSIRHLGILDDEKADLFNQKEYHKAKYKSDDLFNLNAEDSVDYLEWAIDEFERITINKSTRMGFLTVGDDPFTYKQVAYGADDIILPLKIKKIQQAKEYYPKKCIQLEMNFISVLGDIELKGLPFNRNVWMETFRSNQKIYHERHLKLNQWVEENYPNFCDKTDIFTGKPVCAIKWGSPKQVIAFFKHLGVCPQARSKSTGRIEDTVGAKEVFKILRKDLKQKFFKDEATDIEDKDTFALNYLLFKKSEQAITTFGEEWLKYVHPLTKNVHSSFRQILNTGRISSTNPNCQNIGKGEEYRSAFYAPEGFKVVNADYSSQEVRVLAQIGESQVLRDFFNIGDPTFGEDFHSFTASRMFSVLWDRTVVLNKKDNPEERDKAKALTFKISYGGGAVSLAADLGISIPEAEAFIKAWLDAFPGLEANFKARKKKVLESGYIEIDAITGRRWFANFFDRMKSLRKDLDKYFPRDFFEWDYKQQKTFKDQIYAKHPALAKKNSDYWQLKGKLERAGLNYPIQGLSGSMTKGAAIRIRKRFLTENTNAWITNLVHDEINVLATDEHAEIALKIVVEEMEFAGNYFCPDVRVTASGKISNYWGH